MSSTTESPIRKVIFLQKIFRFAGRTVKDLVIINFVCKDFEETMQAHHTFNLVLYDNIIKKRKDEDDFLERSVGFLSTAPAWIVYQWTVVNEHDETQRELLKEFLLYQAQHEHKILIRKIVSGEDPSTTRELLCHILDSCVKLGIVKEVLETCTHGWNCITLAISRKLSTTLLALLIESCALHGLDMRKMLEQNDYDGYDIFMLAIYSQLPVNTFKLLIESCVQHGLDMNKMVEHKNSADWNCIMIAARFQCPVDLFKLLIKFFVEYGDMKKILEHRDSFQGWNCIMTAASSSFFPTDSFQVLIESCVEHADLTTILEQRTLSRKNCIMVAVENDEFDSDNFKLLMESCDHHDVYMKKMLEEKDEEGWNSIMLAARSQLSFDSFRLLISNFPSNESFQATLLAKNRQNHRAVEYAETAEIKAFLVDPDCWKKCCEWRKQQ